MKRFYSMNHSHYKSSYNLSNRYDNIQNTKNLVESKDHNKARSTGTQYYEIMGDSIDSYPQRRLDPASIILSSYNSKVSHLSPRKKISHNLSPNKTKRIKLHQNSETLMDDHSDKKRAGVLGAVISKDMEVEELEGVECSMCGDVGIAELLFVCSKCFLRPQHTYCGRSYPNLCGKASICNWCLHEQDSSTSTAEKGSIVPDNPASASETNRMNVRSDVSVIHLVEKLQIIPASAHVNEGYSDEALVEIMGRHGKAFDYLLLIAAQSSLPQVISHQTNDEIKQTADMINITGPKIMGSSVHDNKAICESDRKALKKDLTKSNGSLKNQARISNDRERSMTGLVKKLNMEIVQSAVDILTVQEARIDHGGVQYAGEDLPKRQRCSKGVDVAALKCRKRELQPASPPRPNFRRYKLLADVVC